MVGALKLAGASVLRSTSPTGSAAAAQEAPPSTSFRRHSTPDLTAVKAPLLPAMPEPDEGGVAAGAMTTTRSENPSAGGAGSLDGVGADRTVRRRSLLFGSRRLTVDTKQKLIADLIEKETQKPSDAIDSSGCTSKQHPAAAIQTPGMVLSVWGSATNDDDRFQPYFAQKRMNFDGEIRRMQHRIGLMSHRGFKPDAPNQDDFFVLARSESLLFGVMDGHGPNGHIVSHFTQERLPAKIMEHLRQDNEDWRRAVRQSVETLTNVAKREMLDKATDSGTTVTVAMLDRVPLGAGPDGEPERGGQCLRLRTAFLGDSIAVHASRASSSSAWEVSVLTDIHRPDRPDEEERIKAAGGGVLPAGFSCPGSPSRLITPEWGLAMSRSFGDFHCVKYGLSHKPEFSSAVELRPDAEHLVLICSDGIWDVIPPAQAAAFVGKFRPDEAQLAVERLVAKAQLRWQEIGEVVDDITAILVWPSFEASSESSTPSGDVS
uniref:PPM-type phosphatase domain-containing protein n=1 Tax=Zooxanthella nutricula TaxID=1333877 RepID=A0A7S2KY46_9DINO